MPGRLAVLLCVMIWLVACHRADDRGARAAPAPEKSSSSADAAAAAAHVLFAPEGRAPIRISVEVARSEAQRRRGLMYRQHLAEDAGMLFLFDDEQVQTFWMKNTLIPLDMIFVTGDMRVAGVVENATPLTLDGRSVGRASRYVVEVNGGWARANGVTEGTRVEFEGVSGEGTP